MKSAWRPSHRRPLGGRHSLGGGNAEDLIARAYADEADSYNSSLLVCLPKKPSGQTDTGDDFYDPESTRPLALVNTDNRLVAAAAKRRWERILQDFVYAH